MEWLAIGAIILILLLNKTKPTNDDGGDGGDGGGGGGTDKLYNWKNLRQFSLQESEKAIIRGAEDITIGKKVASMLGTTSSVLLATIGWIAVFYIVGNEVSLAVSSFLDGIFESSNKYFVSLDNLKSADTVIRLSLDCKIALLRPVSIISSLNATQQQGLRNFFIGFTKGVIVNGVNVNLGFNAVKCYNLSGNETLWRDGGMSTGVNYFVLAVNVIKSAPSELSPASASYINIAEVEKFGDTMNTEFWSYVHNAGLGASIIPHGQPGFAIDIKNAQGVIDP